jgi:hypothetical protein
MVPCAVPIFLRYNVPLPPSHPTIGNCCMSSGLGSGQENDNGGYNDSGYWIRLRRRRRTITLGSPLSPSNIISTSFRLNSWSWLTRVWASVVVGQTTTMDPTTVDITFIAFKNHLSAILHEKDQQHTNDPQLTIFTPTLMQ